MVIFTRHKEWNVGSDDKNLNYNCDSVVLADFVSLTKSHPSNLNTPELNKPPS